jgi:hypothetical protein
MDEANGDRAIQILTLEYQTLREEIMVRTSGRFQFLGLMTTAAALLGTGFFSSSAFKVHVWLSAGLAIAVLVFGLSGFWVLGRQVVAMSARIAQIEGQINALLPAEVRKTSALSWESDHQDRSSFERVVMGLAPRRRSIAKGRMTV